MLRCLKIINVVQIILESSFLLSHFTSLVPVASTKYLVYGLGEMAWNDYYCSPSRVVIGYDEGSIMVKLGREVPVASMDNSGKIIWAKHNEIQTVNIKSVGADFEV